MAKVKTYTLTLDAQELHDLIEAALVCECQNAEAARAMQRKGYDIGAQKLNDKNTQKKRMVKKIQETKGKASKN